MCGGENFKNIWVGLSVGKVGLCQVAIIVHRAKVRLFFGCKVVHFLVRIVKVALCLVLL